MPAKAAMDCLDTVGVVGTGRGREREAEQCTHGGCCVRADKCRRAAALVRTAESPAPPDRPCHQRRHRRGCEQHACVVGAAELLGNRETTEEAADIRAVADDELHRIRGQSPDRDGPRLRAGRGAARRDSATAAAPDRWTGWPSRFATSRRRRSARRSRCRREARRLHRQGARPAIRARARDRDFRKHARLKNRAKSDTNRHMPPSLATS